MKTKGRSKTRQTSGLVSAEVFESAALFNDRLGKLLENSVHVSALSRPQALKETNMAAITGNDHGQVGILLHRLHRNGCKQTRSICSCVPAVFLPFSPCIHSMMNRCSDRSSGLTVRWGEDIVSSIQTQHWHLHRFQLVHGTGITVVIIIGWIAEHYGGEPLIKLSDGSRLHQTT